MKERRKRERIICKEKEIKKKRKEKPKKTIWR